MPRLAESFRAFSLLRQASSATLEALAGETETRQVPCGEFLWRAGSVPTHVFLLRRGLVEIVRPTASGAEVGLALFGARECPGLFASLDGREFPADARVLSESAEVMEVPRLRLLEVVDADPEVGRAMSEVLRHHNAVLREKVDVLTAGEVPQRLATLFLVLLERFGDEGEHGEQQLPMVLARSVLARLVNARVETVIRVLSKWDKEAFVKTSPRGFIVHDTGRLRAEAGR